MQNTVEIDHHTNVTRTFLGISGLMALVVGILILLFPASSGMAVLQVTAVIVAAWALITGVVYLGVSVFNKSQGTRTRVLFFIIGLLFLVGGFIVAFNIKATAAVLGFALAITVGVLWIIEGIFAFMSLGYRASKTWGVIYGIISIVAGVVVIIHPFAGMATLWWFLGIALAVMGVVQIIRAFSMRV